MKEVKSTSNNKIPIDTKVFAKGLCFYKLFLLFVIGSVIGSYYEEILYAIQTWWAYGTPTWELRRGVIYGPFNVVYGFGLVLIVAFLCKKERKWYVTYLYGFIGGGVLEYLISLFQEKFLGTISWDYSWHMLNFGGRTSIPVMIFWGLCALAVVHLIYPFLSSLIEKIPYKIGMILTTTLIILLTFDIFVSWGALIRQTIRHMGYAPLTPIGELYDRIYPDEFLAKYYRNMVKTK